MLIEGQAGSKDGDMPVNLAHIFFYRSLGYAALYNQNPHHIRSDVYD